MADRNLGSILNLKFQTPSTILIIAILLGWERFWLNDVLWGVFKLTLGIVSLIFWPLYFVFLIWWVVDLFTAQKRAKEYNFKKFMQAADLI
jgi:TM2 domain-containing membrane protein YozV